MLIDDKIPIQLNYTPYSEVTSDVLWVGRSIVIQPGLSDNMLELIYKQALGCVLHITISARVVALFTRENIPNIIWVIAIIIKTW